MAAHHTPVSMNRPDPGVKYGDQELIVKSLRPEKAIMTDSVFQYRSVFGTSRWKSRKQLGACTMLLVLAVPNSQSGIYKLMPMCPGPYFLSVSQELTAKPLSFFHI